MKVLKMFRTTIDGLNFGNDHNENKQTTLKYICEIVFVQTEWVKENEKKFSDL